MLRESASEEKISEGQPSTAELALWLSIKDSDNPDDYEVYLRAFPGGAFEARVRQKLQELSEGAAEQAAILSRFDGEWIGRAKLSSGTNRYCAKSKFRMTISGNQVVGETWRGADLEGTIDDTGRLEATTYHGGTGYGGENATVEGAYEDGEIVGTAAGERGVCRWTFTLTKKEPS